MVVGRMLSSALAGAPLISFTRPQFIKRKQNLAIFLMVCKLSNHQVTKNLEYIQNDESNIKNETTQRSNNKENRPLLVLLSWLLSKPKHVTKYTDLYIKQGFDIVVVSLTPWQLMWPKDGSRLVATDLLEFLIQHQSYQRILLHGFSVGAYLWGEVLDVLLSNPEKYNNVLDRIVGQVWDSVADVSELTIGTPRAVFPNSVILQNLLQKYLEYHLKAFSEQSTQYYIRSSQLFHTNLVRTPALFFISKIDPVGSLASNMKVRNTWDTLGVKTYVKLFEKSPHVGHYRQYPKEYVAELHAFLDKLNLIQK